MTKSEERFLMILKDAFHPGEGIPSCTELPAIGDFIDWKSIFDTARKQNLFPLIYDAATTYPSFAGFGQVCPQYFTAATASMAVQMRKNTDFLALYKAFLDVDLAPVTVKGIICRELYGEKADFRPSGDEDLLIEKKDYEKMVSVLEACGYHSSLQLDRAQSVPQEITFYGENLTIELHLSPFGMEKMNAWFRDVFQRSETLEVKGIPVKTMTPTDHFLFLVFHAFKHFTFGGFGVRIMLDILLSMEKYENQMDWSRMDQALEDVGACGFLADLIEMGNQWLGFQLTQRYRPVCPAELLEDMFRMGTFGNATGTDWIAGRMVSDTVQKKGISGKIHHNQLLSCLRLIFPSWKMWISWKPYLKDQPWMILREWMRRARRYLFDGTARNDIKRLNKSYKIASERIELLGKYEIL